MKQLISNFEFSAGYSPAMWQKCILKVIKYYSLSLFDFLQIQISCNKMIRYLDILDIAFYIYLITNSSVNVITVFLHIFYWFNFVCILLILRNGFYSAREPIYISWGKNVDGMTLLKDTLWFYCKLRW